MIINFSHQGSILKEHEEFIGLEEPQVKAVLRTKLKDDFIIREDVPGRHMIEGVPVKVDFMLEAKPHIIKLGFPTHEIPLEVKQLSDEDNKSVRAAWQAITYSQSEFDGKRPPFVLLFPPIRLFLKNRKECEHRDCLISLLPKANVGELSFHKNGEWQIYFGSQRFFSPSRGLGPQAHAAYKRYVGSWK